jgi:hypothetical protein
MAEIYGAELVTQVFGHWPSFHDAEVVRLTLGRTKEYGTGPRLLADVHAFEMTSEVDHHGRYVLRNHVLVSFRFDGVQDLDLSGFNNQNALSEIVFKNIATVAFPDPAWEVVLDGVHGVSAAFRCRDVMVVSVKPWNAASGAPAA